MLFAIDIGNTNIVIALVDEDRIVNRWRLSTDTKRTCDEYYIIILQLLNSIELELSDISDVIISCVVPQHLFEIKRLCDRYIKVTPLIVGEANVETNIKVCLDNLSEVGADRIVNAVAAFSEHNKGTIIIDFGTATTFDVVSSKGEYIGGVIAPGINLSIEALHNAAAKLPEIAIKNPKKVIGTSTISAMQSGVFFGYICLVEGIINRIKNEHNEDLEVITTGGLARLFEKEIDLIDRLEPDLTIKGLNEIYKVNVKNG